MDELNKTYCTYCGSLLLPGTSICEACGKSIPKPAYNSTTNTQFNQNSNSMFQSSPVQQYNSNTANQNTSQPDLNDPRVKRNIVEFVNSKPKLLTITELKEIFLAYIVIYFGFIGQRLFLHDVELQQAIFETIALILGIFGVWLLIDKIVSYNYNLYPQFKFDPERILLSLFFAFIFIGFPPGYFRYRIWVKKLPKPNNIIKIQFISSLSLILYGYIWYFLIFTHSLPDIFLFFPFIIGISVGIGILPIGNFRLILKWNKYLYIFLVIITVILTLLGFQMLYLHLMTF